MATTVNTYTLNLNDVKTYIIAVALIVGNIVLPQLVHFIPNGGLTWLPIYFFTLIGAYKYGWKVGVLTAILSPAVNCLLFGMPAPAMVTVIAVKSTILALVAAWVAKHMGVTLLAFVAVVIGYQIIGGLFEWAWTSSFIAAVQDFKIGIPGLLLQIFGGYAILRYILND
jgi:hypothetical protein